MNTFQQIIQKAANIFNPTQQVANKLNQAIYSFFNGYFYTLPDNKKTYLDEGYRKNLDVYSIIRLIAGKSADARLKGIKYNAQGEEVELPKTDYLQRLLKKPNDKVRQQDRKSTRLNSSHSRASRMPSSA